MISKFTKLNLKALFYVSFDFNMSLHEHSEGPQSGLNLFSYSHLSPEHFPVTFFFLNYEYDVTQMNMGVLAFTWLTTQGNIFMSNQ